MSSTARAVCPHCRTGFQVPSAVLGKKTRCTKCGEGFTITKAADAVQDEPVAARPSYQEAPPIAKDHLRSASGVTGAPGSAAAVEADSSHEFAPSTAMPPLPRPPRSASSLDGEVVVEDRSSVFASPTDALAVSLGRLAKVCSALGYLFGFGGAYAAAAQLARLLQRHETSAAWEPTVSVYMAATYLLGGIILGVVWFLAAKYVQLMMRIDQRLAAETGLLQELQKSVSELRDRFD